MASKQHPPPQPPTPPLEAPINERIPLFTADADTDQGTSTAKSYIDDIKEDFGKPWPATFDRGVQILAGPVFNPSLAADFTKSPAVRARHGTVTNLQRGYHTPDAPPSLLASPGTPAWLKRGLVRMKSLDYTFNERNTAIPTPKQERALRHRQLTLDAKAYRHKILGKVGGSSSTGHLALEKAETDVPKSPGFHREKQMDKQRKKEREVEQNSSEEEDNKSSFWQCTFNMANILMVSCFASVCCL